MNKKNGGWYNIKLLMMFNIKQQLDWTLSELIHAHATQLSSCWYNNYE